MPKRFKAVIFDLFGTLVYKVSQKERQWFLNRLASDMVVPADDFLDLWYATFDERDLGVYQTIADNIAAILERLGLERTRPQIQKAAEREMEFMRKNIQLRLESLATVARLKGQGYRLGLISGCSPEIPEIFEDLPVSRFFDVKIFSCQWRRSKPDPRIYQEAVRQLDVRAEECLYVGDGDGNELTGAANVGMFPVLFKDLDEDPENVYRVNNEASSWKGPVINSLEEVFRLL